MARRSEMGEYVVDLLAPLGEASYRFMFGGFGVYLDGLMIGIVADEVFLLRADDENRPDFEARGIPPFRPYPDKDQTMPYYAVPDDVFEDPDEFLKWAQKSRQAALRHKVAAGTKAAKKKRKGRSAASG